MTEVLFYHLERATLESVLPGMLEKTLERGWKAVVRCATSETVARLDDLLWTYNDEAFLPHSADRARAAEQRVFLTDRDETPNQAEVLFLTDNAASDAAGIASFVRCVAIFDGGDGAAVVAAQKFWTEVTAAGHEATYWKQSREGRWEKAIAGIA